MFALLRATLQACKDAYGSPWRMLSGEQLRLASADFDSEQRPAFAMPLAPLQVCRSPSIPATTLPCMLHGFQGLTSS